MEYYHYDTLRQDAMRQNLLIHPTLVVNDLENYKPILFDIQLAYRFNTPEKPVEKIAELCNE